MPLYQPWDGSRYADSIGAMLLRRGDIEAQRAQQIANAQAQAQQARGQAWGGAAQNIAGSVGEALTGYMKQREEAPLRAAQVARLKANTEAQTQETEAKQRLTRQDAAFAGLFEMFPDGKIPPKELMSIYGPQKGLVIAQGLEAFHATPDPKDLDAKADVLRKRMQGMQALSPALRAQLYPEVRQKSIRDGLITADDAPEAYDEGWWAQAMSYGQAPKLQAIDPTHPVVDLNTGETVREGAPRPAPAASNPTEASLARDAASADPAISGPAREALRLLRLQRPEPQDPQARSGYFTMTPVYDAQGRPVGAVRLNARTGEITTVKPDEMGGGVTARPPGTLGQQTIANEASLDSLARLKKMFDQGAKDDIGPAEGRARSFGQKVPGGGLVTTERFANFEAATRAFQNAMIKAITGAQMSEPEAKRIMGQIPNVNDNATVWQAKYTQSVKNMEDLERRTRTDRGAPEGDALLDELLRGAP